MNMKVFLNVNETMDGMEISKRLNRLFPDGFWAKFSCIHRSDSLIKESRERELYEALYGTKEGRDMSCSGTQRSVSFDVYELQAETDGLGSQEEKSERISVEMSGPDGKEFAEFNAALLAFLCPDTPLSGELLFATEEAAVCQHTDPSGSGQSGAVYVRGELIGTVPIPFTFVWNGCQGVEEHAGKAALPQDILGVIADVVREVDGRTATEILLALENKWGIGTDDPEEGGWHTIIASLIGRLVKNDELKFHMRMQRPHLLFARQMDGGDPEQEGRRRIAENWLSKDTRWRRVDGIFAELGIPELENVCASQGGFAGTAYEDEDD